MVRAVAGDAGYKGRELVIVGVLYVGVFGLGEAPSSVHIVGVVGELASIGDVSSLSIFSAICSHNFPSVSKSERWRGSMASFAISAQYSAL
jgi:hypothetical protein